MVSVGSGQIAIGHRPGKALVPVLQDHGITHVLTLLSESEGAPDIIDRLGAAGFTSLWLPLAGAKPIEDPQKLAQVHELYEELDRLLERHNKIFVHCSAGIHRTGMITYGYLRHRDIDPESAAELLGQMRTVTIEGVTDTRMEWGEQFAPQG